MDSSSQQDPSFNINNDTINTNIPKNNSNKFIKLEPQKNISHQTLESIQDLQTLRQKSVIEPQFAAYNVKNTNSKKSLGYKTRQGQSYDKLFKAKKTLNQSSISFSKLGQISNNTHQISELIKEPSGNLYFPKLNTKIDNLKDIESLEKKSNIIKNTPKLMDKMQFYSEITHSKRNKSLSNLYQNNSSLNSGYLQNQMSQFSKPSELHNSITVLEGDNKGQGNNIKNILSTEGDNSVLENLAFSNNKQQQKPKKSIQIQIENNILESQQQKSIQKQSNNLSQVTSPNNRKSIEFFQEKKEKLQKKQKKQLQTGSFNQYPLNLFDEQEINEPDYIKMFEEGVQIGWTRQVNDGKVIWMECTVSEYNPIKKLFKVHVQNYGSITTKYVKRLNIMFTFDNKVDFEQRYQNAMQVRQDYLLLQNNTLNLNEEAVSIKVDQRDENFQRMFKKTFLPRLQSFLKSQQIQEFKKQILQLYKFHIVDFNQKYWISNDINEFNKIYLKSLALKEKPLSQINSNKQFTGYPSQEIIAFSTQDQQQNQLNNYELLQEFNAKQVEVSYCQTENFEEFFYNKKNKDNYSIKFKKNFSQIQTKVKLFSFQSSKQEQSSSYTLYIQTKNNQQPYLCQKSSFQKEQLSTFLDHKETMIADQIRQVQQMMLAFISRLKDIQVFQQFMKNLHSPCAPTSENIAKIYTMSSIQEVKKLDMLAYRTEKGINQLKLDYPDFIKGVEYRYFSLCNQQLGSSIQTCFINSISDLVQYFEDFFSFLPLPELTAPVAEQLGKHFYIKRQQARKKHNLDEDKIDICVSKDYEKETFLQNYLATQELLSNIDQQNQQQQQQQAQQNQRRFSFYRSANILQEFDDKIVSHRGSNFMQMSTEMNKEFSGLKYRNSYESQKERIEQMNKQNTTYSSQKKGVKQVMYKLVKINDFRTIPEEFFELQTSDSKIINSICHELLFAMKNRQMPLTFMHEVQGVPLLQDLLLKTHHKSNLQQQQQNNTKNSKLKKLPFRPKFIIQLEYFKDFIRPSKQKPQERQEERLQFRKAVYQKNQQNTNFTQIKGQKVHNQRTKESSRKEEQKKSPIISTQLAYLELEQCFFTYNPSLQKLEEYINQYFLESLNEFQKIPKIGTNGIEMFQFQYLHEYIKVLKSQIDNFMPWSLYTPIAIQLIINPFQYIFTQKKYLVKDVIEQFNEDKSPLNLVYEIQMLNLDRAFFKNQLPNFINAGFFIIDLQKIKQEALENVDKYIEELQSALINRLEQKLRESQKKMLFLYNKLKQVPQKIADFIDFLKFIDSKDLEEYYTFIDDQSEEIDLYMEACDTFKLQIQKQEYKSYIESALWVSQLKKLENHAKLILEKLQPQFEKELQENSATIKEKYQQILAKKEELRQFNSLEEAYTASQLSESLKKEFDQINDQAQTVNQQEKFLNLKLTDFQDIPVQLNNLRKYVELWDLAKNWKFNKQNWQHSSISMIDPKELVDIINSGLQLLSELREEFQTEPKMKEIVRCLEEEIIEFNKNTQLLLILRDNCFTQIYWDQLCLEMYKIKKDHNSLNLNQLLKDDIKNHTKFIYELYKTASMQNKIESDIYRIEQHLHKQVLHFKPFYKDFNDIFFKFIDQGENILVVLSDAKMHCQVLTQRKIEENLHLMKKVNSLQEISINGKKILKKIYKIQSFLIQQTPFMIQEYAQYQFNNYPKLNTLFLQIVEDFNHIITQFQNGQQRSVLYLFNFFAYDDDEHKLKLSHMSQEEIYNTIEDLEQKIDKFKLMLNDQIQYLRQQHVRLNLISDSQILNLFSNVQQDAEIFFQSILRNCFQGIKHWELEKSTVTITHPKREDSPEEYTENIYENSFKILKLKNSQDEPILEEFLPIQAEVSPQGIVELVEELEEDLKKFMQTNFHQNILPLIKLNMDFKEIWKKIHHQQLLLQNAQIILMLQFYHDITCLMFNYQMKSANVPIQEVFQDYLQNYQNNFKQFVSFYRHNKEHHYGSSKAEHSKCQGFIQLILGFMDILSFIIQQKVQNLQNFEFFSLPKFSLQLKEQDLDYNMEDFIQKIDETVYPLMLLREKDSLSKFSEHNVYFKHFLQKDYKITLISMNNSLEYGWELQDLQESFEFTSIISFQRQYFQLIKAFNEMECGVILSNRVSQNNSIYMYLSRILARFTQNIVIQQDYNNLDFMGLAIEACSQKGFFLNIENLHLIDSKTLSYLASTVQLIKQAFFNENKFQIFHHQNSQQYYISENFGIFCSYIQSEYSDNITTKLHANILDHFRIISLKLPSTQQIIQGYLRGIDLKDNFVVSLKITNMFQLLETGLQNAYLFLNNYQDEGEEYYRNIEQDNQQIVYFHMTLPKIYNIFQIVQYFVYDKQIDQYQKGQVELILYSAFYNYFQRIYTPQELKIFTNIFIIYFPNLNLNMSIYHYDHYIDYDLYARKKSKLISQRQQSSPQSQKDALTQQQKQHFSVLSIQQSQYLQQDTLGKLLYRNQQRKRRFIEDIQQQQNQSNSNSSQEGSESELEEDDIHDPQERMRVRIKNFYMEYMLINPGKQVLEVTHQMVNIVLHKQSIMVTGSETTFKFTLKVISQQILEIMQLKDNLDSFFLHYINLQGNSLDHILGYYDEDKKEQIKGYLEKIFEQIYRSSNKNKFTYPLQDSYKKSREIFKCEKVLDIQKLEWQKLIEQQQQEQNQINKNRKKQKIDYSQTQKNNNNNDFTTENMNQFHFNEKYDWLVFSFFNQNSTQNEDEKTEILLKQIQQREFQQQQAKLKISKEQQVLIYCQNISNFTPSTLSSFQHIHLQPIDQKEIFLNWIETHLIQQNSFFNLCEKTLRVCFLYIFQQMNATIKKLANNQFLNTNSSALLNNFLPYLEILLNEFRKIKVVRGEYIISEASPNNSSIEAMAVYSSITSYRSKQKKLEQKIELEVLIDLPIQAIFIFAYVWSVGNIFCPQDKYNRGVFSDQLMKCLQQLQNNQLSIYPNSKQLPVAQNLKSKIYHLKQKQEENNLKIQGLSTIFDLVFDIQKNEWVQIDHMSNIQLKGDNCIDHQLNNDYFSVREMMRIYPQIFEVDELKHISRFQQQIQEDEKLIELDNQNFFIFTNNMRISKYFLDFFFYYGKNISISGQNYSGKSSLMEYQQKFYERFQLDIGIFLKKLNKNMHISQVQKIIEKSFLKKSNQILVNKDTHKKFGIVYIDDLHLAKIEVQSAVNLLKRDFAWYSQHRHQFTRLDKIRIASNIHNYQQNDFDISAHLRLDDMDYFKLSTIFQNIVMDLKFDIQPKFMEEIQLFVSQFAYKIISNIDTLNHLKSVYKIDVGIEKCIQAVRIFSESKITLQNYKPLWQKIIQQNFSQQFMINFQFQSHQQDESNVVENEQLLDDSQFLNSRMRIASIDLKTPTKNQKDYKDNVFQFDMQPDSIAEEPRSNYMSQSYSNKSSPSKQSQQKESQQQYDDIQSPTTIQRRQRQPTQIQPTLLPLALEDQISREIAEILNFLQNHKQLQQQENQQSQNTQKDKKYIRIKRQFSTIIQDNKQRQILEQQKQQSLRLIQYLVFQKYSSQTNNYLQKYVKINMQKQALCNEFLEIFGLFGIQQQQQQYLGESGGSNASSPHNSVSNNWRIYMEKLDYTSNPLFQKQINIKKLTPTFKQNQLTQFNKKLKKFLKNKPEFLYIFCYIFDRSNLQFLYQIYDQIRYYLSVLDSNILVDLQAYDITYLQAVLTLYNEILNQPKFVCMDESSQVVQTQENVQSNVQLDTFQDLDSLSPTKKQNSIVQSQKNQPNQQQNHQQQNKYYFNYIDNCQQLITLLKRRGEQLIRLQENHILKQHILIYSSDIDQQRQLQEFIQNFLCRANISCLFGNNIMKQSSYMVIKQKHPQYKHSNDHKILQGFFIDLLRKNVRFVLPYDNKESIIRADLLEKFYIFRLCNFNNINEQQQQQPKKQQQGTFTDLNMEQSDNKKQQQKEKEEKEEKEDELKLEFLNSLIDPDSKQKIKVVYTYEQELNNTQLQSKQQNYNNKTNSQQQQQQNLILNLDSCLQRVQILQIEIFNNLKLLIKNQKQETGPLTSIKDIQTKLDDKLKQLYLSYIEEKKYYMVLEDKALALEESHQELLEKISQLEEEKEEQKEEEEENKEQNLISLKKQSDTLENEKKDLQTQTKLHTKNLETIKKHITEINDLIQNLVNNLQFLSYECHPLLALLKNKQNQQEDNQENDDDYTYITSLSFILSCYIIQGLKYPENISHHFLTTLQDVFQFKWTSLYGLPLYRLIQPPEFLLQIYQMKNVPTSEKLLEKLAIIDLLLFDLQNPECLIVKDQANILFQYLQEKLKYQSKFTIEEYVPSKKSTHNFSEAIEKGKLLILRDPDSQFFPYIYPILQHQKHYFLRQKIYQKFFQNYSDLLDQNHPLTQQKELNFMGKTIEMHPQFKLIIILNGQTNLYNFSQQQQNQNQNQQQYQDNNFQYILNNMFLIDLNLSSKELFGNTCNDLFVSHFYHQEKQFYIQKWYNRIEIFKNFIFSRSQIINSLQNLHLTDPKSFKDFQKLYPQDQELKDQIKSLEIDFQSEKNDKKLEEIDYKLTLHREVLDILNLFNHRLNPQTQKLELSQNFLLEKLDPSQPDSLMIQKYYHKQLIKLQIQFLPVSEFVYTIKFALLELQKQSLKNSNKHIYLNFISDRFFIDQIRQIVQEFQKDRIKKRVPQEFYSRFLSKFYKNIFCSLDKEDQVQFQLIYVQILQITAYSSKYSNYNWTMLKNYNIIDNQEFLGFQKSSFISQFQTFYDSTKHIYDFSYLAPLVNFNIEYKRKAVTQLAQKIFQKSVLNKKKDDNNSQQQQNKLEQQQPQLGTKTFGLSFLNILGNNKLTTSSTSNNSNNTIEEKKDDPPIQRQDQQKKSIFNINNKESRKSRQLTLQGKLKELKKRNSLISPHNSSSQDMDSHRSRNSSQKTIQQQQQKNNNNPPQLKISLINNTIIKSNNNTQPYPTLASPMNKTPKSPAKGQQQKSPKNFDQFQGRQNKHKQTMKQALQNLRQHKHRQKSGQHSNITSLNSQMIEEFDENTSNATDLQNRDFEADLPSHRQQNQQTLDDLESMESNSEDYFSDEEQYMEYKGYQNQQQKVRFFSQESIPVNVLKGQPLYQKIQNIQTIQQQYGQQDDENQSYRSVSEIDTDEFSSDSECSIDKYEYRHNDYHRKKKKNQAIQEEENEDDQDQKQLNKEQITTQKHKRKRNKFMYAFQFMEQVFDKDLHLHKHKRTYSARNIPDMNHKKFFLQLKQLHQSQLQQQQHLQVQDINQRDRTSKFTIQQLEQFSLEQILNLSNNSQFEPIQLPNYHLKPTQKKMDIWYIAPHFVKSYIEQKDQYSHHYSIDIPSLQLLPQNQLKNLQVGQSGASNFMKKLQGAGQQAKKMSISGQGFLGSLLVPQMNNSNKRATAFQNQNQNQNQITTHLSSQLESAMNLQEESDEESDSDNYYSDVSSLKNEENELHQKLQKRSLNDKRPGIFNTNKIIKKTISYDYQRHWYGNVNYQSLYTLLDLTRNLDIKEFVYSLNLEKKYWHKVLFNPEAKVFSQEFKNSNETFSDFIQYTPQLTQLLLMKLFRPDVFQYMGLQLMGTTGKVFEKISSDNINQHIISNWLNKPTILYNDKVGFSSSVYLENKAVQLQKKCIFVRDIQELIQKVDEKEDIWVVIENFNSFSKQDIVYGFRIIQQKLREADYYNGGEQLKIWIVIDYTSLKVDNSKFQLIQQFSSYCWIVFNSLATTTKQDYTDILHVEMEEFLKSQKYSVVQHRKLKAQISIPLLHVYGKYDLGQKVKLNIQRMFKRYSKTVQTSIKQVNLHQFFFSEKFKIEQLEKGDVFEDYSQKVKYDSLLFYIFYKQRLRIKNREIFITNQQFSDIIDSLLIFLFEYRMKPHLLVKKYFDYSIDNKDFNSVYKLYFDRNFKDQYSISINNQKYRLFQPKIKDQISPEELLFEQVNSLPDKDSYEVFALSTNTELINNYWKSQFIIQNMSIVNPKDDLQSTQFNHIQQKKSPNIQSQFIQNSPKPHTSQKKAMTYIHPSPRQLTQHKEKEKESNQDNNNSNKYLNKRCKFMVKFDLLKTQLVQHQQKQELNSFMSQFNEFAMEIFEIFKFEDLIFFSDLSDIQDNIVDQYRLWIKQCPNIYEETQIAEVNTYQNMRRLSRQSYTTSTRGSKGSTPKMSDLIKPKKDIDIAMQDFSSFIQQEKKRKRKALKNTQKLSISENSDQDIMTMSQLQNPMGQSDYKTRLKNISLQDKKQTQIIYPREEFKDLENQSQEDNQKRVQNFRRTDSSQVRNKTVSLGVPSNTLNLPTLPKDKSHSTIKRRTFNQIEIVEESDNEEDLEEKKNNQNKDQNVGSTQYLNTQENESNARISFQFKSQASTDSDDIDDIEEFESPRSPQDSIQNKGTLDLIQQEDLESKKKLSYLEYTEKEINIQDQEEEEQKDQNQPQIKIKRENIARQYMQKRNTYIQKRQSVKTSIPALQINQQQQLQLIQQNQSQMDSQRSTLNNIEEDEEDYSSPSQIQIFQQQITHEIRYCNTVVKKVLKDLQKMNSFYLQNSLLHLSEELQQTYEQIQLKGETPKTWLSLFQVESKYLYQQKYLITDFVKLLLVKFEYLKVLIQDRKCKMYKVLEFNKMFNPIQLIGSLLWAQALEYQKPIYQFKIMIEFILDEKQVLDEQLPRHGIQAKGISIREGRIDSETLFLQEARLREFEYHFPTFRLFVVPHNSEKKTSDIGIYLHTKGLLLERDKEKQQQYKEKKEKSEHVQIKINNPCQNLSVLPFNLVFHFHSDKKQEFWDTNETQISFDQVFQTE